MKKNIKSLYYLLLITSLSSCVNIGKPSNSENSQINSSTSSESSEVSNTTSIESSVISNESSLNVESSETNEESSVLSEESSEAYVESSSSSEEAVDNVVKPGASHSNTGTSKELLNVAFNGNSNEHYTFNNLNSSVIPDGASRLNLTENVQTLEYNDGYIVPSTGYVKALVIPVDFPDSFVSNSERRITSTPDWQSVSSFYYNSSYGQLNIEFDVLDWYTCKNNSSYYEKYKKSNFSGEVPGVSAIIDEALSYYSKTMDLSIYDSNNDGNIDSLYIVYNHEIDYDNGDFWWAYQYAFMDEYTYDGVYPYNYMFAGYDFLFENNCFGEACLCNTHTLIHETGHMFGLEDYYDYDENEGCNKGGFAGADLMDATVGDHNAFSKMSLGWIKNPILVKFKKEDHEYIDITLKPFEDSGDVIMICDDYSAQKGMFQNYFLLEYYTPTKLHEYDAIYDESGIRVLRVNAELAKYTEDGYSYEYFKYDNSYTAKNLIDVVCANKTKEAIYSNSEYLEFSATSDNLFKEGDSKNALYYSSNKTSSYYFKVMSLNDNEAVIRILHK